MKYDRLRLLLVDDDPGAARLVRELLHQVDAFPFELMHVETPHAALECLSRQLSDAVVFDLTQKGDAGLDGLRRVVQAAPAVAVVALAADAAGEAGVAAVRAGAQDCLVRSELTGRALARVIRHGVERARLDGRQRAELERERRARKAADDAVHTRDEVLAVVAHDLRNPLGAINTTTALLATGRLDPKEWPARLDVIRSCAERMDRLIQDLLDIASLASGTLRVDARPTEVGPVVEEAMAAFGAQAEQAGVGLVRELEPDLPDVLADRGRMLQIITNLIANAVRFTPRGGSIVVRARVFGDAVLFGVSDTGPGIAAEEITRLFDSAWQAEHARPDGTGRGLAITRGIVEAHGGRVWAASEVGKGSTFFFTIPRADGAPAGTSEREETEAAIEAASLDDEPVRVLLVDDHAAIRHGLAEILRRAPGVEVVGEASSGVEALAQSRRLRPDIVVMDLVMPGIDGIEATRRLTSELPDVRVLALTAESDDDALIPVLRAGGRGLVRKTTAHEDVVGALRAVARDGIFLYPSGNRILLGDLLRRPDGEDGPLSGLSGRERELLRLTAEGFTSREIARKLYLSPNTVDSYRSRLMRRLGVEHRPALVRLALETGLLAAD